MVRIVNQYGGDGLKDIQDNDGYCPCKLEKIPENKCICCEFRNQVRDKAFGLCYCGVFENIKGED